MPLALKALVFALGLGALGADAQQPQKPYRVGVIFIAAPVSGLIGAEPVNIGARTFSRAMREFGYIEGNNLVMEWRSAEGKLERVPDIVRGLVSLKVDVIVTVTNRMTEAAKEVTRTVPIVMAASVSPVETGLVQSLARPGGNVTGLTLDAGPDIVRKRLELLKDLFPKLSRVAYLRAQAEQVLDDRIIEAGAKEMGVRLLLIDHLPTQYADAFDLIARERPDALLPANNASNYANRRQIVEFAAKIRLPAMYPTREYADAGGLMAYGVNILDQMRRAAGYVDRILKGARPADLPIEQPTKFELVLNLRTAKSLGLTFPRSLLLRADHLIE